MTFNHLSRNRVAQMTRGSRLVFKDCMPYVSLFIAIRGDKWNLRMAALRQQTTAFDHPIYQKFITNHIQDVLQMPEELFKTGGFTVSISGRVSISGHVFHSVGLEESHDMLINKQAVVRPTKDYINIIARYIPLRIKYIEHLSKK